MQTNCVIYSSQDGRNPVLGMVVGESADVRGAIQRYQKTSGPINNRAAFNDFVQQSKGVLTIAPCVPIDTTTI